MTQDTRDRIRHLYFVERMPLRRIAETLTLAPHAVRSALVLPGGQPARRDPQPVATALAANDPTPISNLSAVAAASARRRIAPRHR
jgi:hypothetical protein